MTGVDKPCRWLYKWIPVVISPYLWVMALLIGVLSPFSDDPIYNCLVAGTIILPTPTMHIKKNGNPSKSPYICINTLDPHKTGPHLMTLCQRSGKLAHQPFFKKKRWAFFWMDDKKPMGKGSNGDERYMYPSNPLVASGILLGGLLACHAVVKIPSKKFPPPGKPRNVPFFIGNWTAGFGGPKLMEINLRNWFSRQAKWNQDTKVAPAGTNVWIGPWYVFRRRSNGGGVGGCGVFAYKDAWDGTIYLHLPLNVAIFHLMSR